MTADPSITQAMEVIASVISVEFDAETTRATVSQLSAAASALLQAKSESAKISEDRSDQLFFFLMQCHAQEHAPQVLADAILLATVLLFYNGWDHGYGLEWAREAMSRIFSTNSAPPR